MHVTGEPVVVRKSVSKVLVSSCSLALTVCAFSTPLWRGLFVLAAHVVWSIVVVFTASAVDTGSVLLYGHLSGHCTA
jgi:hypothetical protein